MNAQAILSALLESRPAANLQEGPLDAHVLKAVFLAGSGGSGKGFIGSQAGLNSMGFRYVNIDTGFEYLLKKAGIDPGKDIFTHATQALREPAKRMMNAQMALYLDGKLPLVIDATAAKQAKTLDLKRRLEAEGYDCCMICVDVTLHRSIEGNKQRAMRGGRNIDNHPNAPIVPNVDPGVDPKKVLDGSVLRQDWKDLQKAKIAYRNAFGRYYMAIDNNQFLDAEDVRRKLVPMLYRAVLKLVAGPVRNPIGKEWLERMNAIGPRGRDVGGKTTGRGLGLDQRSLDPQALADPNAGKTSGERSSFKKFMAKTSESFDPAKVKAAFFGEAAKSSDKPFYRATRVSVAPVTRDGVDGFRVTAYLNTGIDFPAWLRTKQGADEMAAHFKTMHKLGTMQKQQDQMAAIAKADFLRWKAGLGESFDAAGIKAALLS